MKPGRTLLFGTLGVLVVLGAAVGAAFSPGVQTWAVRRVLARQPGNQVTVGRVAAGLNQIRVENVTLVQGGAVLKLPAAEVDLPVIAAALQHKLQIRRMEAHGWTLDLTHLSVPAASPAASWAPVQRPAEFSLLPSAYADTAATLPPIVFSGIFRQLRLPVDLALARVNLDGDVLLPQLPGHPAARAHVTLAGGNLAAGVPGQFDYTAVVQFAGEGVTVSELRVRGTLGVVMDTPRSITRIMATTAAEALGPKFPDGVKLAVDVSAAQSASGENYAVAVLSGAKQIGAVEASYAAGESHLRGTWRLDMHDTDLAPFMLGRELPGFEAVGDGRFDVDTTFTELNASGRLKASANRLNAINPEMAVLGAVQLTAVFDVAQRGNATRVDRLAVIIVGAKPVATVQALQPFEFNPQTGELNVADPARDLLGVVFQGVPLAWVDPLLARTGLVLNGRDLQGELAASARNGGFTVRTKAPMTLGNLSVSQADGRPLLRAVDVSLTASADYAPRGWQVEIAPLTVTTQGNSLLTLELKAGQLSGKGQPVKVAGTWSTQLPGLLAQPVVGEAAFLTGGVAQGDLAGSFAAKREIQVRLALTNLTAASLGALPSLAADFRADLQPDGKIEYNLPVTIERDGRKSDLTFAGTAAAAADGWGINARVGSNLLVLDDVKAFAIPFMAELDATAHPAKVTSANPGRPAQPFWSGFSGPCAIALKQVNWADQLHVADVTGTLRLDAGSFKLADGRAGFGTDSTVKINGGLTFNAANAQPYGFGAEVTLGNFDLTALFRALDPTRPPTIEGRVDLVTHLTGAGVTLDELAAKTRGDLMLTGRSGIFRALSADLSDKIQRTQSRVAVIGSLLGVVPDDYINKSKILADIAKTLSAIPYDQLSLTATRDTALNLVLKDFSLISPEIRLGGQGTIRYVQGIPVVSQPLDLQCNLGARGRVADLFKRAGLLADTQDSLGYAAFSVPLRLGGTAAKPDTSAIRDALLNSALERSGLLDGIFGRPK